MPFLLVAQSALFAVALVLVVRYFVGLIGRREQAWAIERAALVNHIQFGERMPTSPPRSPAPSRETAAPRADEDEYALVGSVQPARET